MSFSIPISALALYPLIYLLPLNLLRFRWGLEEGLAPMPVTVMKKAEVLDRVVLCVTHVILLLAVTFLLNSCPISTYEVGLTTDNWKSAVGLGVLFSLLPLGLNELLLRNISINDLREQPEGQGPAAVWYGLVTLGSFTHEFWRVFCILSLIRLGLSGWGAILIVAVVYGALHIQTSVAKVLGSVTFGGAAGFLFVDTGSLLSPLTMSLIVAGANLYQIRHAVIQQTRSNQETRFPESLYSTPCPVCGAIIRRLEVHTEGGILACPSCGESLTIEMTNSWVIAALSLAVAIYATRHLVYREPTYLPVTAVVAVILSLVGAFLLGFIAPPKYKRVGGKTFDKALSLFGTNKSETTKK